MFTHSKGPRVEWKSILWQALRLILAAFQSKVPLTGWDPLVGQPMWHEVFQGGNQPSHAARGCKVNLTDRKPIDQELTLAVVKQPSSEPKHLALTLVEVRGGSGVTLREMSERYRIASSHSRVFSKEARN